MGREQQAVTIKDYCSLSQGRTILLNDSTDASGRKIGHIFISNIVFLGLISLFMDMSTEMVYPLIPLYLASFGVTPAIVGVIEGIAESVAAFLKVLSGWWGDKTGREKQLSFAGYSGSVIYKILLLASTSWVGILIARICDKTGKGIRTAPRDAMVAASGGDKKLGSAFGLHKMLDMLGSAIGILLALLIVGAGLPFQTAFLYSLIPAVIALAFIPLVKNVSRKRESVNGARFNWHGLHLNNKLTAYLGVIFLFSLGNSSNAFLLLRAGAVGLSSTQVILMYLIYSMASSLLAYPMGRLSDKIGRGKLLVLGYLVYGLVYLGFAFFQSVAAMPFLFALYGLYNALISGAERAYISENAPAEYKGTVLGISGMLQGFGLLLASVIAGLLWNNFGGDAPFYFGGAMAVLSAVLVAIIIGTCGKQLTT